MPPIKTSDDVKKWFKEQGLTIKAAAEKLGMHRQTLYEHLDKKPLTEWFLYLLNTKLGMSVDGDKESKGNAILLDMSDKQVMYVPLVNQFAYGGYKRGYADPEYIESLPKVPWIVDKQYKGIYMSIEVRGDSMDDNSRESIIEGDTLLCREIKPDLWRTSKLHIKKWDFVIVHKIEGIIVKRIIEHDTTKGAITIHSLNEVYPDEVMQLNDVAQIFNVVQVARKK